VNRLLVATWARVQRALSGEPRLKSGDVVKVYEDASGDEFYSTQPWLARLIRASPNGRGWLAAVAQERLPCDDQRVTKLRGDQVFLKPTDKLRLWVPVV